MNKLWEYRKIGDVCVVERGGSPRPIDKFITVDEDGINWIKIGDTSDSMYITETAQKIIPEGMKKSRYVKPGDFLLSNSMSFGRPYILKIDGCIHDGWLVLRDEQEFFDKRFLYYYLSSKTTYEKFRSMAVGGVVNNLNSEMVRKVEVPVPSKTEQSDIADLLDGLKQVLDSRKKELQLLDELIKARFVEMFGNPDINEKKWNEYKMEQLCEVGSSKRIYQNDQSLTGIPFLRISDLVNRMDTGSKGCDLFIPEELFGKLKKQGLVPVRGDILLTARGTLGRCYIIQDEDEFYFQDGMITWLSKYDERITPLYISYLFEMPGFRKQIDSLQAGSTVAYLSISMTKKLNVMTPPIELQNQFADFVRAVDKSKVAVQKTLEQTQTLFDSLMQKYFG